MSSREVTKTQNMNNLKALAMQKNHGLFFGAQK